jgi:hypothetical protein
MKIMLAGHDISMCAVWIPIGKWAGSEPSGDQTDAASNPPKVFYEFENEQ